ncbi:NAD(P)/FAD-dependent oxidoreductase [Pullulanibacillus sp. KACC 23026]|uniref:NAD(P)/FAD-dependent oxidoreductase n=1 Tax=Pullulanibacillus sp. KACC 23026 TaxID=3028315 RepID=UPI0023AEBE25|nr:NAD(P)/FAD-dependent oxidoreductase [Pullulanibacillus sp. KACC 23026]WEG12822.1 NAD(P)/FAD-dependent oxidoreductase [Pullulanibacillus sp. KACC 23026]
MTDEHLYDVTIVGGGPVGLYAAFYSGMRKLKTKVIDYLPKLGGKVSFFYPQKWIFDIGGIPSVTGEDLSLQLEEQARSVEPTIILGELVKQIDKQDDQYFVLTTENGNLHYSKTVILAIGSGYFIMRKHHLDEGKKVQRNNLHYSIDEMERFRGKKVVVSGWGGGAVNWATLLSEYAEQVWLINEKKQFTAHKPDIEKLLESTVQVKTKCSIVDFIEGEGVIQSVCIKDLESGRLEEVPVDEVVVNHETIIQLGGVDQWGVHLENDKIPVNAEMKTNIPGLFAAGDIVNYPNKIPLIASGFAEAMAAINSAALYLEPSAPKILYSTVVLSKKKTKK